MSATQRVLRLYLVRHALSAANLDKTVNATLPDHAVPLAPVIGREQAVGAAKFLIPELRRHGGRTRLLYSPYLRTRQTAGILSAELDLAGVAHDMREDISLREISFGLFDGVADEDLPAKFPEEYSHYQKHMTVEAGSRNAPGEFWARMPMGESRAEVADRVKSSFGTILRDSDPDRDDPVVNFVVVSHGVTLRAFVMQWMHHPYEWYARQTNPNNASVQLISALHPPPPGDLELAERHYAEHGNARYAHREVFLGYPHQRGAQQLREDGQVQ